MAKGGEYVRRVSENRLVVHYGGMVIALSSQEHTVTNQPTQAPSIGFETTVQAGFEQAIEDVTAALKTEGFGVLTSIDVKRTLKEKIDQDVAPYTILGACNPTLAHRALQAAPQVGLLLPCNVVVSEVDGATRVSIIDPMQMMGVAGENPELVAVATEATARLRRVIDALAGAS